MTLVALEEFKDARARIIRLVVSTTKFSIMRSYGRVVGRGSKTRFLINVGAYRHAPRVVRDAPCILVGMILRDPKRICQLCETVPCHAISATRTSDRTASKGRIQLHRQSALPIDCRQIVVGGLGKVGRATVATCLLSAQHWTHICRVEVAGSSWRRQRLLQKISETIWVSRRYTMKG